MFAHQHRPQRKGAHLPHPFLPAPRCGMEEGDPPARKPHKAAKSTKDDKRERAELERRGKKRPAGDDADGKRRPPPPGGDHTYQRAAAP
eukprot:gene36891-20494_t